MLPRWGLGLCGSAALLSALVLLGSAPGMAQTRRPVRQAAGVPVFVPFYPGYPLYPYPYAYPPVAYPAVPVGPVPDGRAGGVPVPYGQSTTRCLAGAYVCPSDPPGEIGAPCSCPTTTAQVPGRIG